ncbi:hypothetical protein HZ326_19534 [Fusarium oxysporum f. sp. albedinis]|nr:hypothetical protein HZ326_19534 [Fusarium oxysporum f. sp. albedinis]
MMNQSNGGGLAYGRVSLVVSASSPLYRFSLNVQLMNGQPTWLRSGGLNCHAPCAGSEKTVSSSEDSDDNALLWRNCR